MYECRMGTEELMLIQIPPKWLIPFHGNGSQFSAVLHNRMVSHDRTEKFDGCQKKQITAL
jgi:hypothetical protein